MNVFYRNQKTPQLRTQRAQAIVEFALVLPILMALLVGIFEVGRMIYTYAAVNNASREAARFGSALGYDDDGYHKYKDCVGIRNMARKSAFFLNLSDANITIQYDQGPSTSVYTVCDQTAVGEDPGVFLHSSGNPDRVLVTVNASYSPLIRLVPLPSRTFTLASARTILGFVEVSSSSGGGGGGGGGGSGTATSTSAPTTTATATNTATSTPTFTSTATFSGPFASLTPVTPSSTVPPATSAASATVAATATAASTATSTPAIIATNTKTLTPTVTLTNTATFTPTATPTLTPTNVTGCSSITGSAITVNKTMSMTITNPNSYTATIATVHVKWNSTSGANGNPGTLTLNTVTLGTTQIWNGSDTSGDITFAPSVTATIAGNSAPTITFTFAKNYQNPSGNSITITLSTPGCEAVQVKNQ